MILSLPNGYNTEIGPGSEVKLSGGQRQRLALARAMYLDPFVLVLDEPSSNLDKEGREALLKTIKLQSNLGGMVIFVSHEETMLAQANKLALIHEGTLRAFGSPTGIVSS